MDTDNLVRMANRIGDFFDAMPEREEALEGIAQHIRKFWEPRMRRQLLAAIEAGQATQLQEIVRSALDRHKATLAA
ncbi:formate dehydrogenase subunit delta [Pseudorhodoferax sp.]|uniref:formate dehydrogenase subunit delta n=1 Tax=Pseudorhodoferax sp. TaxID=1993553 RepID=UPI002DD67CEE|nr:formate dehydrogenase subunit delta [Pseudorhodoferax sp.]